jgi:uncharacterized protein YcnI
MRISWLWMLLLAICLLLITAGVAWAHVVVSPKETPANQYQKLVVSVPTEKDIPTTKIRVEVPEGFTVTGVQPVPGWQHEFEKDQGVIKSITWSGGEIAPEEFQEFALQAKTPKDAGDYAWKAHQTYKDGSVVEWVGPPDAEEPASVVRVASGGSSTGTHSEGTAGLTSSALPKSGGPTAQAIAPYAGFGLGALILVVMTLLALRWRRSP